MGLTHVSDPAFLTLFFVVLLLSFPISSGHAKGGFGSFSRILFWYGNEVSKLFWIFANSLLMHVHFAFLFDLQGPRVKSWGFDSRFQTLFGDAFGNLTCRYRLLARRFRFPRACLRCKSSHLGDEASVLWSIFPVCCDTLQNCVGKAKRVRVAVHRTSCPCSRVKEMCCASSSEHCPPRDGEFDEKHFGAFSSQSPSVSRRRHSSEQKTRRHSRSS